MGAFLRGSGRIHTIETTIRGALVPPLFDASISGIYERVANLKIEDELGPYLISVVTELKYWTELAILATPALLTRVAAAGIGASLTLAHSGDLSITTTHDGAQPDGARPGGMPVARVLPRETAPAPPLRRSLDLPTPPLETLTACRAALLCDYPDTGFVALLSAGGEAGRVRPTVTGDGSEVAATLGGRSPFVRRAAVLLESGDSSALLGLGPGLTPAGDDFLSGMMLAEDIATRPERDRPASLNRAALGTGLRRTTSAGASLLRLALAAHPPAYQISMVEALAAGRENQAIAIAAAHGHSSGLDALSGFLFAFDSLTASV